MVYRRAGSRSRISPQEQDDVWVWVTQPETNPIYWALSSPSPRTGMNPRAIHTNPAKAD